MNRSKQEVSIVGIAILLLVAGSVSLARYSGGTGEPNDPYRISTPNDLNDIGNHVEDYNKCFVMVNDINLAQYTGTQFNTIGNIDSHFVGVFDGNGFVISNFNSSTEYSYIGLHSVFDFFEGLLEDVTLTDVNVFSIGKGGGALAGSNSGTIIDCHVTGSVSSHGHFGGLVGSNSGLINRSDFAGQASGFIELGGLCGLNNGTISNCYSSANITGVGSGVLCGLNAGTIVSCFSTGTAQGRYSAGVCGRNNSMISNCGTTVNVSGDVVGGLCADNYGTISACYAMGSVSGAETLGGLCGLNMGTISECYSTGDLSGDRNLGGLCGTNYFGEVFNSYAVGRVDGNSTAGGLVGYEEGGSYISCFWDQTLNPDVNGIGSFSDPNVIGKSTVEMMEDATFTDAGWDFVDVWGIGEGQTYPYLRKHAAGDMNKSGLVDWRDFEIFALHWLEGGEI
jgi:hypothetical protein